MNLFGKRKSKQSITDLLKINIFKIPDETFTFEKSEINNEDEKIQFYTKDLDYNELGIFNKISTIGSDKKKNIIFFNDSLNNLSIYQIAKTIDMLYEIYGKDDEGKKKFNSKEESDFYSETNYGLFGRSWINKYPEYPGALSIDRDDNIIEFTLWFVPIMK